LNEPDRKQIFSRLCLGQEKIQKDYLIDLLRDPNPKQKADYLLDKAPYMLQELCSYLTNNDIQIFSYITVNTKMLRKEQFKKLLNDIGFKPSNPKEVA